MRIAGEGSKLGTVIDIDPALRARLDEDMATGDLAQLERRYNRRAIADYALFPGAGAEPMGDRWFARLFTKYEADCGIEKMDKRGRYGLRRTMTDAMNEET